MTSGSMVYYHTIRVVIYPMMMFKLYSLEFKYTPKLWLLLLERVLKDEIYK